MATTPTTVTKETPRGNVSVSTNVERRRITDPAEVEPVLNEQMTRSREIEAMGVENWKAMQDQRPIEEQPVLIENALAGGQSVLNTPVEGQRRVQGITHPVAETPQRAPVRNSDGSIPR
jgi:hypothetical protein